MVIFRRVFRPYEAIHKVYNQSALPPSTKRNPDQFFRSMDEFGKVYGLVFCHGYHNDSQFSDFESLGFCKKWIA